MPTYTYDCNTCNESSKHFVSHKDVQLNCATCGDVMVRNFPLGVHTVVGSQLDSKDVGKVIQQKNDILKKKWSGYKREEQSIREKMAKLVNDKVGKK
jgi:predicted nucleic acid-binding Zn ribbon protein